MKNPNEDIIKIFEGFATSEQDTRAVSEYLSMLPRLSQYYFIRQFEIYHKENLSSIISNIINKTSFFSLFYESSTFFGFEFVSPDSSENNKGYIAILPGKFENFSRITTISRSGFWKYVVQRLVKKFYPLAIPVYFRQDEIEMALLNLEKGLGNNFQIRISDVTAKEIRNKIKNSKYYKYDTQRLWTDQTISEVFGQAKANGQWFTGLNFVIQKRIGTSDKYQNKSTGRLYKSGEIVFDSFYSQISEYLLNDLEIKAQKRFSTFEGRGLRERDYRPVKPIELTFNVDVFSEIEEIRRFGNILNKYPNATKVVYHSNPYYYASIADFLDGSSFNVWVLSQNKVVVLPKAKSSAQAFERLIGYISSNFMEGVVNEYQYQ